MLGWLCLGVSLALGALVSRRVFREWNAPAFAGSSFALGLAFLLLVCNWAWRWTVSPWPVLIVGAGLGMLVWRLPDPPRPETHGKLSAANAAFALFLALVIWFALAIQAMSMVVEGDFFVHVANIGLFRNGHFPPRAPMTGEPMHGHYGRDLLISAISAYTGADSLTVEWVYTVLVQMAAALLLYGWISREVRPLAALLVTVLVFTAASISTLSGAIDALSNNNPTAVLFWILSSWAVFHLCHPRLSAGRKLPALCTALVLAADAVVYEVHFGLMILAIGPLFLLRRTRALLVTGVLAVLLAILCGGTLGELPARLLGRGPQLSPEQQLAQQKVSFGIAPQPLHYRTDNLRPSLPFETKLRPWSVDLGAPARVLPIWHTWMLSVFWYPVWLLPLTVFVLRKDPLGVWFGALSWLALLVPGWVEFGAFSNENARWFYVVALGAAACLGLACARLPTRAFPVLLLVCYFATAGGQVRWRHLRQAFAHPGVALPTGQPGPISSSIVPAPLKSLQVHYGIGAEDREACAWLRAHARSTDRVLANDFDQDWNARCTRLGWMGIFPAGYYSSPTVLGTYPMDGNGRLFWATGDQLYAVAAGADWIYALGNTSLEWGTPQFENRRVRIYAVESSLRLQTASPELRVRDAVAPADQPAVIPCEGSGLTWVRWGPQPPMLGVAKDGRLTLWPPPPGSYPVEISARREGPWQTIGHLGVQRDSTSREGR